MLPAKDLSQNPPNHPNTLLGVSLFHGPNKLCWPPEGSLMARNIRQWHAQSFIFSSVKFRWFRWSFGPALHPGLPSAFFRRFLSKEKVSAGVYYGCCLPNSLSVDVDFSVWSHVFGIGRPSVVWDWSTSDFSFF